MLIRFHSIIFSLPILLGLAACGGGGNGTNSHSPVTLQSVTVAPDNPAVGKREVLGYKLTGKYSDGSSKLLIPTDDQALDSPNEQNQDNDTVITAASSVTPVVPINAGLLAITLVTINPSQEELYDPHVDGDFASYSELVGFEQFIHYYQFSTGLDTIVPRALPGGAVANDFLSDVQGNRIVFNRFDPTNGDTESMLYDIPTASMVAINPRPGSQRFGISIGANTVAYADMGVVDPALQIGEIYYWNVLTHDVIRLTNDTLYDDYPNVSPAGDVIVWEKCKAPFTDCDIMIARPSTNGWTVSVVAGTTLNEIAPDTSSTITAWQANSGDSYGWDIHWAPVGSSAIQRLQLTDDQFHPRVAGKVIVFESQNPTTLRTELYIYDTATNRLFQITNTPTNDETLSDVTLLPSGELRIVWQAIDFTTLIPHNSLYAATIMLPGVVCGDDKCYEDNNGQHNDHH